MKKYIILIIIIIQSAASLLYTQFSKSQMDELTAAGISRAIEPESYNVQKKVKELTGTYNNNEYIKAVCAVFDDLYRNWNYTPDPNGMEYFEEAGISAKTYTGDCDDFATLMVSMIKALGGDGRVICVSGHAYAEMYLGKDLTEAEINDLYSQISRYYEEKGYKYKIRGINIHPGPDNSSWLNMDYQQWYPGGRFVDYSPDAEHLVIYPGGNYELAYLNR